MKFSAIQIVLIGIVGVIVVAGILLFTGVIPGLRKSNGSATTGAISVWGVFDSEKAVNDTLVADFKKAYPNVTVTYRQLDSNTYEQDLINALAAGNGPDVFMIQNNWLIKHADKLAPLATKDFPVSKLKELFPDIVANDLSANNQVYALPLYIDSLALFYNKVIFDNAGIAGPPTTWDEFITDVSRLTRFDQTGRITRAGAAIGASSRNINSATDLLSLIMLQDGVQMISNSSPEASFARTGGADALNFYTSFTQPNNRAYTWDPSFHYSIDAFGEESTAMIFNYAFQIPLIKQKNPFLNFAVAGMPQKTGADRAVNYANYFGLGVSKKSARPDLAWAFIFSSTLDASNNARYLNAAVRPPALRTLINNSINDPVVGVFSRQALTAASWPQVDSAAIDAIFTQMIDAVVSGQLDTTRAINHAQEQVTTLMQSKI